ncbi:MAG: hypothetical protein CVU24_04875 [Betaproteobacteria bacterium HGW-Betaproteobacteria-18]|nr:MAG: hypothetical protein CVU24_04875 [Betaproteobacteria bacterium HGW-Betaproteobacteria-18]
MRHTSVKQQPSWKKTAIYGAVAVAMATSSGLAMAVEANPPCDGSGDGTLSVSTSAQCTPASTAVATVASGVTIEVTSGAAVYYDNNLGDDVEGAYVGSLTNNGTIQSIGVNTLSEPNIGVDVGNEILGTLTNNGLIKASATSDGGGSDAVAVGIREGSQQYTLQGTISNTGTIQVDADDSGYYADATGIYIANDVGTTGVINNSGTINVNAMSSNSWTDATGILVQGDVSGSILNEGTLTTTATGNNGSYAQGIRFGSLTETGSITNAGTINVNATSSNSWADATGIATWGDVSGSIVNEGTLTTTATGNNGSYAEGIIVRSLTETGSITNSGNIQTTATGGYANAIGVAVWNQAGRFTNSGTIQATADRIHEESWGYAVGVELYNLGSESGSATFENTATGVIRASGLNGAQAYGVYTNSYYGGTTASIVNAGEMTATATGGGDAYGLEVDAYSGGVSITNSGTISAHADVGEGTGFYGYGYGDLTLQNSGTITGTSGPDYNGYSVYSHGFNIDNTSSGKLIGALYADGDGEGGSIAVTNAGLIDLPLFVTPEISLLGISSSYSGFVGGDFTQTSTGTLRIAADSANAGGYSQLYVTGTANLAGTIDVNVLNSGANLAIGNTLYGVVQAGTLNGTFSQVTDNSVLFNFKDHYYVTAEGEDYPTPRVDLEVVKGLTAEQSVIFTSTLPALGAARTFDAIIDSGTSDPGMQAVIDALGGLDTEQKVSDAVSQTMPLLTGGSMQAAAHALSGINRVVQARNENNRGLSSGDVFAGDKHLWLKPFGSRADQDDRNAVAGFKADTAGLVIGADGAVSDITRAGVAFAYARSDITSRSAVAPQSADVDVYKLIGYGSYKLDERTELNYQVDLGKNSNEGRRSISFMGTVASAKYDSLTAHAGVGWGRIVNLNERTSWVPSVRADYTWIKDSAYSETGAGALNLNVDGRSTQELILAADAKVLHKLNDATNLTANVGVGYDTLNKQASVTAAFAGAPGLSFVTHGLEQDPWLVRGGFGLTHSYAKGVEVTARYDLEHRQGFNNQTVSVKARWAF